MKTITPYRPYRSWKIARAKYSRHSPRTCCGFGRQHCYMENFRLKVAATNSVPIVIEN